MFNLYAEYIMKILGWMNHKLKSRLLGGISITSGMQMDLGKGMAIHSSNLLENPHGQRSLAVYSPWGRKESDMTERLN